DVARALFYMDTRYEGDATDGEADNFTLTDNTALINTSSAYMGKLSTLLRWNYQDGITNAERKRNYQVDTMYQHNRNPFVDHPEYVWSVFGSGPNTSQITISGGTAGSSGASSKSVALRVIKGSSFGTASVTLAKSGATPTTYDVNVAGNATTTAAGVGQPFDYDPVNRAIDVGMTGSTAATGTFSGTITIDNTDLTNNGAGTGTGSLDGNDTINVTGTVLEHSNGSLDAASDVNAKTIDFGYCPAGFATRAL